MTVVTMEQEAFEKLVIDSAKAFVDWRKQQPVLRDALDALPFYGCLNVSAYGHAFSVDASRLRRLIQDELAVLAAGCKRVAAELRGAPEANPTCQKPEQNQDGGTGT